MKPLDYDFVTKISAKAGLFLWQNVGIAIISYYIISECYKMAPNR